MCPVLFVQRRGGARGWPCHWLLPGCAETPGLEAATPGAGRFDRKHRHAYRSDDRACGWGLAWVLSLMNQNPAPQGR